MKIRSFVFVFIFLLISPFAYGTKLTILSINDTHGHLEGYPAISALVNKIREEVKKEGGYVLFVHSGDFNTGTPESDMLKAEPDIEVFNQIGMDVATIGNHEFDNDFSVLRKQVKQAHFPFLLANVKPKDPKYFHFAPSMMKKIDGEDIYIIGVTTNDLKNLVTKKKGDMLILKDPIDVVKKYISTLPKGAFVLVLSHMGVKGEKNSGPNDIRDEDLAGKVQGISVIVGAHSHTAIKKPREVNGTLIVQAGKYSEWLARLDLDVEKGKVMDYRYELISTKGKEEDPKVREIVNKYLEKSAKKLDVVIGVNKTFLDNQNSEKEETAIGDLTSDAMRAKGGCDVAVQGGGGIRSSLKEGNIKIRDIFTIHPFGNTIVKTKLTGAELDSILDEAVGNGKFMQVSGMNMHINGTNVTIDKVKDKKFNPKSPYLLCTDSFLAGGGDGLNKLNNIKNKKYTGLYVHDGLIDYIKKNHNIDYKVGDRIIIEK
jgi:5'-nucleotidase/UDP-sugar diphosphatase